MHRLVDQFPHGKRSASRPHPLPLSRARERGADGGVSACWQVKILLGTIRQVESDPEPHARNLTAAQRATCWSQIEGTMWCTEGAAGAFLTF